MQRDGHGQIVGGRLLEYHLVAVGSVDELRAWFKDVGPGWSEVTDIEAEIGRD